RIRGNRGAEPLDDVAVVVVVRWLHQRQAEGGHGSREYNGTVPATRTGGGAMHNHSIPEPQWKSVFDSLSRIYDGTPSSLEILAGDVGAQYQVENQPFRGVDYDRTGIELHFA